MSSQEENCTFGSLLSFTAIGSIDQPSVTLNIQIETQGNFVLGKLMDDVCIEGITYDDLSEIRIMLSAPNGKIYSLVNSGDLSGSVFGEDICLNSIVQWTNVFSNDIISVEGTWSIIIEDIVVNNQRGSLDRSYMIMINPEYIDLEIYTDDNQKVDANYIIDSDVAF